MRRRRRKYILLKKSLVGSKLRMGLVKKIIEAERTQIYIYDGYSVEFHLCMCLLFGKEVFSFIAKSLVPFFLS